MLSVLNSKKTMVVGVVVFVFLIMQIASFAGEDWEVITQLPTKRWALATAVVDDKIYIVGGTLSKDFNGPFGVSTVEVYDTQTDTWERVADMSTLRTYAKAAVVDGIIYVFGGYSSKDRNGANDKYPVSVEAYDPATDTWTRKQDMPVPRVHFAHGVVDGKVYLIGGSTGWSQAHERQMDRVDIYAPATDSWEEGPKMPTPRDPYTGGVVNNRIYAIGGYGRPDGQVLTAIEAYDPISSQWQQKNDMLDDRYSFRTVAVEDDIYVIGGYTWQGIGFAVNFLANVDVYDPQTETWSEIPAMPRAIYPQGAATVDGKIYVFGGIGTGGQKISDVVVFDTNSFDTGARAVTAKGKLSTRWGELKVEP